MLYRLWVNFGLKQISRSLIYLKFLRLLICENFVFSSKSHSGEEEKVCTLCSINRPGKNCKKWKINHFSSISEISLTSAIGPIISAAEPEGLDVAAAAAAAGAASWKSSFLRGARRGRLPPRASVCVCVRACACACVSGRRDLLLFCIFLRRTAPQRTYPSLCARGSLKKPLRIFYNFDRVDRGGRGIKEIPQSKHVRFPFSRNLTLRFFFSLHNRYATYRLLFFFLLSLFLLYHCETCITR